MATVTVSPNYELTIPQSIRERMNIKPGQEMEVFWYDGRIEFIPVRHPRELRGFLAGLENDFEREPDRSL